MTVDRTSRRIVVSGATSGLGRAVAERLIAQGDRVWLMGSTDASVASALAEMPGAAGGSGGDIADEAFVEDAIAAARVGLGGVDGAFINAGVDGQAKTALELRAEPFRRLLDVNVVGTFLVATECARQMDGGGRLVLNASVNAVRAEAGFADYNASKAATVSLAQTLALDLADRQITVSCICPGYVRTRMTEPYMDDPEMVRQMLVNVPAGRFGEPHEVAALVDFLLGEEAGYMTGSVISIDGGRGV